VFATVNDVPDHRDGEEANEDDWRIVDGGDCSRDT